MSSKRNVCLFGVALDPWDGQDRVELKRKYMADQLRGKVEFPDFRDPYDALSALLPGEPALGRMGKVTVETWLTPTPSPEDFPLVTVANYTVFIDSNGCREYATKVRKFLDDNLNGRLPLMIGVDHSCTGGVVEKLAEICGNNDLSLIVVDSHSDFIPMDIRYALVRYDREITGRSMNSDHYDPFAFERPRSYNSGTFLYDLIEQGILPPNKIALVGVSDQPSEPAEVTDKRIQDAIAFYHDMEARGLRVVSKNTIEKKGFGSIIHSLADIPESSDIYVSIDIDAGAHAAIVGARQLFEPPIEGLNEGQLYQLIRTLHRVIRRKRLTLKGLDIMETDIYRAGMRLPEGKIDRTYQIEVNLLNSLLRL